MWEIIKGAFKEGQKGSGKAFSAFTAMLIITFICVYSVITGEQIDHAIVLELIGFVCVLYGIKGWTAINNKPTEPKA